jgi:hypothetical protein
MKHGRAPPSRAFEDSHYTDHSIIIDLRNPLGPRWSNDEAQIIPNTVLQHCFRKRLLHGEANSSIFFSILLSTERGSYLRTTTHDTEGIIFSLR